MAVLNFIKDLIKFDNYIMQQRQQDKLKQSITTSMIVAFAFVILSVANIIQNSYLMLIFTASSAFLLFVFILIGALTKKAKIISFATCFICAIIFTIFIFLRGNDGFAVLWLIFVPIISILIIDFKVGFIVSAYFFVILPVLFWTPLQSFLAGGYTQIFLLRFPFYYWTSFAFSLFLCYVLKKNEYKLYQKQKEISYEKDYDKMTGIYNRSKYMAKISGSFQQYDSIGVIFMDVNSLKYVNDNFGHNAGDDLIITTANSLKMTTMSNSYLFRVGGDEFVVVLKNCAEGDCEKFIEEWQTNLDKIKNKNSGYQYSVSYGYAFAKKEYNLNEIVKEADDRMYEYKRNFYQHLKDSGMYNRFYGNK